MNLNKISLEEAQETVKNYERQENGFIGHFSYSCITDCEKLIAEKIRNYLSVPLKVPSSIDPNFGLFLYNEVLPLSGGFDLRSASDDGVWRNLTCRLLPDIIDRRWRIGDESGGYILNLDRLYKIPNRNWFKTLWWFAHLAWQEDENLFKAIMDKSTTDTIAQTVERTSRGYDTLIIRKLFEESYMRSNDLGTNFNKVIRFALKIHLLKSATIDPLTIYNSGNSYLDLLYE